MANSSIPTEIKRNYFSKVPEARAELRAQALKILERFQNVLLSAEANGDFESAIKGYQWLIEHLPAHEDGTRMVDQSIDKPKQVEGYQGPAVQIGFNLSGISQPKELPAGPESAITVEVEPIVEKTKDE